MTETFTHTHPGGALQRWHVCRDFETLSDAVITRLSQCASEAIAERGAFSIVLAGGHTPQAIYRELCELATDWRSWFVYFGDERCLPRAAADRNDTMARQCWLDHVPIPRQQIFAIPAELGAERGAMEYARRFVNLPQFDVVLLGLGEDGHTAGLFPELPLKNAAAYGVSNAPKAPRERVTLSAARLSAAQDVWFLVSGEEKRAALQRWHNGEAIPAAAIVPKNGIDIFTDVDYR